MGPEHENIAVVVFRDPRDRLADGRSDFDTSLDIASVEGEGATAELGKELFERAVDFLCDQLREIAEFDFE